MRAVVQRVSEASVTAEGSVVGAIGPGLVALVAATHSDETATADRLADKLWQVRLFPGEGGGFDASLASRAEAGTPAEVLVVSQFTLYGDTSRGRRPSWTAAARPSHAAPLLDRVAERLRALGASVATGRFGADMAVALVNEGPVTLVVDVD